MTTDLSTLRARAVWERAAHALYTKRELAEYYQREVATMENRFQQDLSPGTYEFDDYTVVVGEDGHVQVAPNKE